MTYYAVAPRDTRYLPLTQQEYCCVPTGIQMIMHRHGIPLMPAEELGYHLGLTVPPEDAHLFYKPRVAVVPPSDAGFGTQIHFSEYEPNAVFQKIGVPLTFSPRLADDLRDKDALLGELRRIEDEDTDALLCFNHGVVKGEFELHSGHVVVFDRIINGKVRIVDASWKQPKWRLIEPSLLLDAIKLHGNKNFGGVWRFAVTPQE